MLVRAESLLEALSLSLNAAPYPSLESEGNGLYETTSFKLISGKRLKKRFCPLLRVWGKIIFGLSLASVSMWNDTLAFLSALPAANRGEQAAKRNNIPKVTDNVRMGPMKQRDANEEENLNVGDIFPNG